MLNRMQKKFAVCLRNFMTRISIAERINDLWQSRYSLDGYGPEESGIIKKREPSQLILA